MNAGRIEQIGTPMAIYERPASLFVAGFIGSPAMNILSATVAEDGVAIRLQNGAKVSLRRNVLPAPGNAVLLGVRPEHLRAGPADQAVEGLTAEVCAVERLGADTFAHCRIAGATRPSGNGLVLRLPGNASVAPGDSISVTIDEAWALFDQSSGRRLGEGRFDVTGADYLGRTGTGVRHSLSSWL